VIAVGPHDQPVRELPPRSFAGLTLSQSADGAAQPAPEYADTKTVPWASRMSGTT